jgi:DNA-binding MarR family transcriptional regulator
MNIMELLAERRNFYIKYPQLGPRHLELLEQIGLYESRGKALTITEAMKLGVGSPATAHRAIDELEFAGLIRKVFHKDDIRTKYLLLDIKGWKYFKRLQKLTEAP